MYYLIFFGELEKKILKANISFGRCKQSVLLSEVSVVACKDMNLPINARVFNIIHVHTIISGVSASPVSNQAVPIRGQDVLGSCSPLCSSREVSAELKWVASLKWALNWSCVSELPVYLLCLRPSLVHRHLMKIKIYNYWPAFSMQQ